MKKIIVTLGLVTFLLLLGIHSVLAQVMRTQPVSAILQKLKNEGYAAVQKIELANDEYQVHAFDEHGYSVIIRMNSFNGEITGMSKTDAHITMADVVDKIEAVGYSGITLIEAKNSHFDVIAIGPDGKKTKLNISAISGKITRVPLS